MVELLNVDFVCIEQKIRVCIHVLVFEYRLLEFRIEDTRLNVDSWSLELKIRVYTYMFEC